MSPLTKLRQAAAAVARVVQKPQSPKSNPAVPRWQQNRFGAWTASEPDVTPSHHALPETRTAVHVAEMARSIGEPLGRGNFGKVFRVETSQGPFAVKFPVTHNIHGQPYSVAQARKDFMHEAGNANQLSRRGFARIVPASVYVELRDGTPAIVREYGEPVTSITPGEFFALEQALVDVEEQGCWRVKDNLSVYRRPDGSLYVGDVGLWEPLPRGGQFEHESDLPVLLRDFAHEVIPALAYVAKLSSIHAELKRVQKTKDTWLAKRAVQTLMDAAKSRRAADAPLSSEILQAIEAGKAKLAQLQKRTPEEEDEDLFNNPRKPRVLEGQLDLLAAAAKRVERVAEQAPTPPPPAEVTKEATAVLASTEKAPVVPVVEEEKSDPQVYAVARFVESESNGGKLHKRAPNRYTIDDFESFDGDTWSLAITADAIRGSSKSGRKISVPLVSGEIDLEDVRGQFLSQLVAPSAATTASPAPSAPAVLVLSTKAPSAIQHAEQKLFVRDAELSKFLNRYVMELWRDPPETVEANALELFDIPRGIPVVEAESKIEAILRLFEEAIEAMERGEVVSHPRVAYYRDRYRYLAKKPSLRQSLYLNAGYQPILPMPQREEAELVSSVEPPTDSRPRIKLLMPRYVAAHSRKGWDIWDRATNTSKLRMLYRKPIQDEDDVGDEVRRLNRAFELELDKFWENDEKTQRSAITALRDAKLIAPELAEEILLGKKLETKIELPEDEQFAEGTREKAVRITRQKAASPRKPSAPKPESAGGEACATVSAAEVAGEPMAPPLRRTFDVLRDKMGDLRAKIAAWNRKAEKFKQAKLQITEGAPFKKELEQIEVVEGERGGKVEIRHKVWRMVVPVTIEGEIPKLAGWEFVARLEAAPGGKANLVWPVGSIPVPLRFRDRVSTCDHCKTARKRKDTYVLYNEEKRRFVQVGGSCLGDFLPGTDPSAVVGLLETLPALVDALAGGENFGYGSIPSDWGLMEYLPYVAQAVRLEGSFSKEHTGRTASEWWYTKMGMNREKAREVPKPTDGDVALAEAATQWWANKPTATTDFEHTLREIAKSRMMTARHTNFVPWIIGTYLRDRGEMMEKKIVQKRESQHVGTIGQKGFETTVVVKGIYGTNSQFGGVVYRLVDLDGNAIVWFSQPGKMQEGGVYRIDATVEKHGEFRGEKQTQLSRISVLEDLSPISSFTPNNNEEAALLELWQASRENRTGVFKIMRLPTNGGQYALMEGDRFVVPYTEAWQFDLRALGQYPELLAFVSSPVKRHALAHSVQMGSATTRAEETVLLRMSNDAQKPGGIAGWKYAKPKGNEIVVFEFGIGKKKQRLVQTHGEAIEPFIARLRAVPELSVYLDELLNRYNGAYSRDALRAAYHALPDEEPQNNPARHNTRAQRMGHGVARSASACR